MESALVLAFIGDSVLELKIRLYFINKGIGKVNELQSITSKYASAKGHLLIMEYLLENNLLTDNEINVFKRGRNTKVNSRRKNFHSKSYHYSTGFESLIGYLFQNNQEERIDELIHIICERVAL